MSGNQDRRELEALLEKAEPVPGTYPPVYIIDDKLIGYDKLEQMYVIETKNEDPELTKTGWKTHITSLGELVVKAGSKISTMLG
ncbi:MAG TPA: hypothetical protein VGD99_02960 [Anaerolineae bacterium]